MAAAEIQELQVMITNLRAEVEALKNAAAAATAQHQQLQEQQQQQQLHQQQQTANMERAMKLEVEAMKAQKMDQDRELEDVRKDMKKMGNPDDGGAAVKDLKGYDYKNAPKPVPYDFGDEHEFHAWRDLMTALMSSYDARWEQILKAWARRLSISWRRTSRTSWP